MTYHIRYVDVENFASYIHISLSLSIYIYTLHQIIGVHLFKDAIWSIYTYFVVNAVCWCVFLEGFVDRSGYSNSFVSWQTWLAYNDVHQTIPYICSQFPVRQPAPPMVWSPQEPPLPAATYYVRLPTTCYSLLPIYYILLLLLTTTYYQLLTTTYPTQPHPTGGGGIGRCCYY